MTNRLGLAVLLMMLAPAAASGDTALHNVSGYSSTDDGIIEFSVLVFDAAGRVVATGDESLLAKYPDATRLTVTVEPSCPD